VASGYPSAMPLADIEGPQRKCIWVQTNPAKGVHGDSGIPIRDGKTLPFIVTRGWNAPAGHYLEAWYLVEPKSRAVLYEGPAHTRLVWGLQSVTEISDRVDEPIELEPGTYTIVVALGGMNGGEFEVEAITVAADVAA
jgi:hypothetical protein